MAALLLPSCVSHASTRSVGKLLRVPKAQLGEPLSNARFLNTQFRHTLFPRLLFSSYPPLQVPESNRAFAYTSLLENPILARSRMRNFAARNDLLAKGDIDDDDKLQIVPDGEPPLPEPKPDWPILERWNVPWDANTTVVGMLAWLFSFLLTGLAVSLVAARLGIGRRQVLDLDEQALFILIHQLAQTIAGLGSLYLVLGRYKPLPSQLFSYDISAPFDLRRGWLLYGGLGIMGAAAAVVVASTVVVKLSGQPPPREFAGSRCFATTVADNWRFSCQEAAGSVGSFSSLSLPCFMEVVIQYFVTDNLKQVFQCVIVEFGGMGLDSTISLIGVTGVLAPFLEETVFRGFFMTSLSKWVPTPVAILISACAFAGAHLTPGEFPQLVSLGVVLGLAYAQTRTLVTPILIHSMWNSGVVVLLTVLRLQGYDIQELL